MPSIFQDEPAARGKPPAAYIALKVVPGSRRDQIVGPLGDRLKVKVAAPPEGGRANQAVCELLAEALGINQRDIELISGHASPEKTVRVVGKTAAELDAAFTQ